MQAYNEEWMCGTSRHFYAQKYMSNARRAYLVGIQSSSYYRRSSRMPCSAELIPAELKNLIDLLRK